MSTLQLFIDLAEDGCSDPCHTFVRRGADPNSDKSAPFQFKDAKLINKSDALTYRGKLRRDGYKPRIMICKVVPVGGRGLEYLKNEADLYENELRSLQGSEIPRYYGLYTGTVTGNPAACILLEDCGVPLIDDGRRFSIELRMTVVEALMAIHKCGVSHGDFEIDNVVVDDAEKPTYVVIVDFGRAERHQCNRAMDICLYEYPPPFANFQCRELYLAAFDMAIWTPDAIWFHGGGVALEFAKSPESLVEHAPRYGPGELERGANPLADAEKAIAKYREEYGDRMDYINGNKREVLEPRIQ